MREMRCRKGKQTRNLRNLTCKGPMGTAEGVTLL